MSLRDVLRFIVLACVFATPFICLYVAESMFFPFISGKNFVFRILVEVMFGAWVLLMFVDAKYRPKFSWIFVAASAFLVVIALADFMGINPYRSFWSNYERMEGLIAHIHLFLYFIIAGSVLATEGVWQWFWRTSLFASLLVAVNAFSQLRGTEEVHQSINRLDATFGNSTYLAVYALFNIFIALFLFFREAKQNPYVRFVYPVIALVNLAVLYYTHTRGTVLGLVGGVFIAFVFAALFDREHPERRKYAVGGVVAVVCLVGAFIALRNSAWIQRDLTLGRLADISLSDSTTQSRFMIWNMSWEGFKEHPILGWGQDNFLYVFAKHYNPKMWNQEPWFDRSHDVFFDWLIAGGALGLLAYLSLFGTTLYYLWFARTRKFTVVESGILTGMLAGYFIHNIFVFDNITSYIVFFGLLAYVHAQSAEDVPQQQVQEHARKKGERTDELEWGDITVAALVVFVLTVGTIYFVNIRNMDANVALINSIRPEGVFVTGANGQKEIAIKGVIDRGLFGTGEAREQLAQIAIQTADPRVPEDIRRTFYDLTASEFDQWLMEDPSNVRTISFAAAFYERFGQFDKALKYFKKAIELSPKRQAAYLDLSQMLAVQGDYKGAEEVAKVSYDLAPESPESVIAYAVALIYEQKLDEAAKVLDPFHDFAAVYQDRVINAYGAGHHYGKVVELVNEKIAKGYSGARDYLALSAGYAGLGQVANARLAVEKAVSLDPALKAQGDQVLTQLKSMSR